MVDGLPWSLIVTSPIRLLPFALLLSTTALAQPAQPLPLPPPIASPVDQPRPGEITLAVDATDLDHHIFRVHESVPVSGAGPLTLLYPRWIPGEHSPTGPLPGLAGLIVHANGARLDWVRDPVDVFAFHVNVPAGAATVELEYQFLSAPTDREGHVAMTNAMLNLKWNTVILAPAGNFARDITFRPSITLPAGWKFATALETGSTQGATIAFQPTDQQTLIDSPLLAGRYFSRIDLDPHGKVPVHLNIAADRPEDLVISAADLNAHRNLVQQAYKNYASAHYKHYDFLFWLSDELGGEGLEHMQSSEDGVDRGYFTQAEKTFAERDLLAHEYTHSWNGKFRRPADLWSPDYTVYPERDSLLWVYEGQTEYWGQVLAARSGIMTAEQVRDQIADYAAFMQAEKGRAWRALEDTTNDPITDSRRPAAWGTWKRGEDYYLEGELIWLDADTLIREKTHNAKSLSDFSRAFFGVQDGRNTPLTYTFEDVVTTLNGVLPYDWKTFLRTRLDGHPAEAPLDGLKRGGWKLAYTDDKPAFIKSDEGLRKTSDFGFSIGFMLGEEGAVQSVLWDSPAFHAGLVQGLKLIAVNGLEYEEPEELAAAITLAKTDKAPIELLLRDGKHFRDVKIDYHGGLRYPHLERIAGTADLLDDILAPVK
jgi:predicted metalloprotease with PDZ domain